MEATPPDGLVVQARPAGVVGRSRPLALRLAARLARRELARRPGRTLLVALMVAVPVAGMVAASVLVRTDALSPHEVWSRQYGTADFAGPRDLGADVAPVDGARVLTVRSAERTLRTADGQRVVTTVTDLPVGDPLTEGMVRVDAGRAPTGPDEVLVSGALARELGVAVGDALDLVRPATVRLTVVGIGARNTDVRAAALVVGPGRTLADLRILDDVGVTTLVDVPGAPTEQAAPRWSAPGWELTAAPGVGDPEPDTSRIALCWVLGAVILTAAGIIITGAFGIGGRRQLTTVGLLAVNGAPAPVLHRTLLLQGAITGAVGTAIGVVLGFGALGAAWPHLDRLWPLGRDGLRWHVLDLGPVIVLGLVVSTIAAAIPAFSIGRVPILAALAGRRPLVRVPDRLTDGGVAVGVAGIGLLAAGVASAAPGGPVPSRAGVVSWIVVGAAGAVLVLLGMCVLTPTIVGRLEGPVRWLPGEWRLAARSLARRRAHTAALVAAVCASSAVTLAAAVFVADPAALPWARPLRPGEAPLDQVRVGAIVDGRRAPVPESVLRRVREELPDAQVIRLTAAGPEGPGPVVLSGEQAKPGPVALPADGVTGATKWPRSRIYFDRRAVLADDAALAVYELSPYARSRLDATGAIVAAGSPGVDMIKWVGAALVATVPSADAPSLDTMLVTQEAAERMGFVTEAGPVVLRNDGPLDPTLVAALYELAPELEAPVFTPGLISRGTIDFSEPPDADVRMLTELLVSAGSVGVTLLVIAVGLGLAGAESRQEQELLTIAGAAPRTLARVSARKAALVILLGTVLAVPVGLVPAWASLDAAGRPEVFAIPWRTLVLLVVVVPVAAGLATRGISGRAQRRRPVRLSTMAVD